MSVNPSNRQLQSVIAGHVAGASWDQKFIAEEAFPSVNVYAEKFGYETWGNEGMEDVGNAKRAINGDTQTVDPPKNSYVEDTLDEYALQTKIDIRLINNARVNDQLRSAIAPPDGLSAVDRLRLGRALRLQYNIKIQLEKAASTIAFGTGNYLSALWYGTGGGSTVIDFTATGLIAKIHAAKRAVARIYGFEPDTFILGYQKYLDMWNNPDVLARITGGANNTNPAIVNFELLAAIFGVKRFLVGSAVTQTQTDPGDNSGATVTDLWTTTTASLIYSGEFATADTSSPAFGKMFYMDVPETSVRYDVQTWLSENGKLEFLEATEFAKFRQIMKSGAIFTT